MGMPKDRRTKFQDALQKGRQSVPLTRDELALLLSAQGEECDQLYATARQVREESFGDKVFAYGFVYFSTYCRNNCTFCFYRSDNTESLRYRKTREEILEISQRLAASGVHMLDLTMGEDPHYVETAEGQDALLEIAGEMKAQTGLPLMFSPGVLPRQAIEKAGAMGVEWYACYQETHNRQLFDKLRGGQSYDARMEAKITARAAGILVEEGILAGVGETLEDVADSIQEMTEREFAQVRIMSFVPQVGAPLRIALGSELYRRELNTIAVMRIAMPGRFIPASLDVAGKAGLQERLDAGANVITSIIAPQSGWAGVSNATLDVDNGGRSLPSVMNTLAQCELRLASQTEFRAAIEKLHLECGLGEGNHRWRQASGS